MCVVCSAIRKGYQKGERAITALRGEIQVIGCRLFYSDGLPKAAKTTKYRKIQGSLRSPDKKVAVAASLREGTRPARANLGELLPRSEYYLRGRLVRLLRTATFSSFGIAAN
jgi:hypothetical protein